MPESGRESKIADFARRLTADVSGLEGVVVALERALPNTQLRAVAEKLGQYLPAELETSISIRIDAQARLTLIFDESPSLIEQFTEGLNQLQDMIVESLLQPWPSCPVHDHVLVPTTDGRDTYWQCPDNSQVQLLVGSLNGLAS
jgi:hypothetical protein